MERPELFKNDDIMDTVFSPDIEEEQAVEPIATAEETQKLGPQVEDISSYSNRRLSVGGDVALSNRNIRKSLWWCLLLFHMASEPEWSMKT